MRQKLCNVATYVMVLAALAIIVLGFWTSADDLGMQLKYAGNIGYLTVDAFTGTVYGAFAGMVRLGALFINPLAQIAMGYYLCRIGLEVTGYNPGTTATRIALTIGCAIVGIYLLALLSGFATSSLASAIAFTYLYGFVDRGLLIVSPFFLAAGIAFAFAHRPLFQTHETA